ncbi:MAG: hypothetical protein RLZ86_1638 [Actinomycetota bacterium]
MSGLDGAVTDGDRAVTHAVDTERVQGGAHADDVDDRVIGADLMKFDLIGVDAVDRAFHFGEARVDGSGPLDDGLGQISCPDHGEHIAGWTVHVGPVVVIVTVVVVIVVAVAVLVGAHHSVHPRASHSASLGRLEGDGHAGQRWRAVGLCDLV